MTSRIALQDERPSKNEARRHTCVVDREHVHGGVWKRIRVRTAWRPMVGARGYPWVGITSQPPDAKTGVCCRGVASTPTPYRVRGLRHSSSTIDRSITAGVGRQAPQQ